MKIDTMLSGLEGVADQVRQRSGDHVDRIGFYTPDAIGLETLDELVRAVRDGTGTAPR